MANTLRFKRGAASGIPTALAGEPLFTTDTFDLYIGNGTGNTRFQKYIASGTTSQLLRGDGSLLTMPIVLTSPANGQVLKFNGTSWVNDSDAGITGSGVNQQIAYFTGATTLGGTNNFFWDAATSRLNINTGGSNGSGTVNIRNSGLNIVYLKGGSATNQGSAYYITNANNSSALCAFGDAASIIGGTPDASVSLYTIASVPLTFNIGGSSERARIFANGNFGIGTGATDSGQRLQVVGTGYFSDSVGIGSTGLTNVRLRNSSNISGGTSSFGYFSDATIQSGVTSIASYFHITPQTQATTFTLTNLYGYFIENPLLGSGSTVTNAFGFYGNIAAATGRWNIFMNGTANNYMAGSLGIGSTNLTARTLVIGRTVTGNTTGYGILQISTYASDVTASAINNYSIVATAAATYTLTNAYNYFVADASKGAGSTITNQFGYYSANLTQGTNNFGFYSDVASTSGRWNFYAAGTASNYFAGKILVGSTTDSGELLQINGSAKITSSLILSGIVQFGTQAIGTGMYWDATNNRLGIGNSAPATNLHVRAASSTIVTIHATSNGTTATPVETRLSWMGSANAIKAQIAGQDKSANLGGGWMIFRTADSTDVLQDRMELDRNGNLSIGLTGGGDFLNIAASTTAKAQINLTNGVAPTSPNNGDIWFDGTDLKMRIGGVTKTFTLI
jgi:hypothetical protein